MCQLWTQSSSSNSSAYRDEPLGAFSEEPGSGLSKGRKISEAHSEGLAWRARGAGRGGTDGRRCGSPGSPSPLGPDAAPQAAARLGPSAAKTFCVPEFCFVSGLSGTGDLEELPRFKQRPPHTHTHTQLNISSPIYAAKEGLVK